MLLVGRPSSAVEQLFCKQQVLGSNPKDGSNGEAAKTRVLHAGFYV